ncbi:MAG: serine hydrolase domain-containing protein [Candidatus Aminicenantales bacterium]
MKRKRIQFSLFIVVFGLICIVSNSFADQNTEKVDALFKAWDTKDSPGCALAIIQDGKIIYKKGYGMANLEHNIPITPSSVFYIGSTSKQFVAMCIVLLARDGKLSLDDDIRKYVPEMPDYGTPVTIRNLIHHTSGIRDYLELVGIIAGMSEERMDEMIGIYHQPDALELITRQKELNFTPGEKFLYSNSCYLLLAEIIKRTSGKTLREYAHENIFEPLGMTNSHFHDDYAEPIKDRASGYYPAKGGKFRLFMSTFDCVGSGGLFTSVEDLFLWDQNFYHHKVGGKELIDQIHTRGHLSNGEEIDYAFALMIGDYKGLKTVRHGGALGGYRAELLRFPEQRFSVICLSNLSSFNPSGMCDKVADIYLADQWKVEKPKEKPPQKVSVNPDVYDDYEGQYQLEDFAGDFYSEELGVTFSLAVKEGKLYFVHKNAPKNPLRLSRPDAFSGGLFDIKFHRDGEKNVTFFTLNTGRVKNLKFVRK